VVSLAETGEGGGAENAIAESDVKAVVLEIMVTSTMELKAEILQHFCLPTANFLFTRQKTFNHVQFL